MKKEFKKARVRERDQDPEEENSGGRTLSFGKDPR